MNDKFFGDFRCFHRCFLLFLETDRVNIRYSRQEILCCLLSASCETTFLQPGRLLLASKNRNTLFAFMSKSSSPTKKDNLYLFRTSSSKQVFRVNFPQIHSGFCHKSLLAFLCLRRLIIYLLRLNSSCAPTVPQISE